MTKTQKIVSAIGISFLIALSILAYNLKQSGRDLGLFMTGGQASETGTFVFDVAKTDSIRIHQEGDSLIIEWPDSTKKMWYPPSLVFKAQALPIQVFIGRAFLFNSIPGEWYTVFSQDSLWLADNDMPGYGEERLSVYSGLDPGSLTN